VSDGFGARLQARLSRVGRSLPGDQCEKLEAYFTLLSRWNKKINLTSLAIDPASDAAIDRLLVEPILAATHGCEAGQCWIDLGSGGGSPAIPMKTVKPRSRLVMVEVRLRKVAFLRESVRALGLRDATVVGERAEVLAASPDFVGQADLVTARAVRPDVDFLDVVKQLLKPGGRLLWFGRTPSAPDLDSAQFDLTGTHQLLPEANSVLSVFTSK
jgi:16S rRNA (guanine527-N7)-methyltransferase